MDNKANGGLAGCLSNVFKLAEVEGLKWVRYIGPNSSSLETPKVDPVLTSYAKLLSEGYACSWSRLSPSTDGVSGEGKDLWVFYFTTLPDLSEQLAPELREESVGSWENGTGMSTESSAMLFRALNGLIERSLLTENFLPLGKWFARSDPSMGSDGRGCFLCNFSFFIYAHLYICASVDVRAGPALQPLLQSHLYQALASSSGMQVILSPSGLNAIMTGHSYQVTDPGIEELLDEWKLFYPLRFETETQSQLPAAVEVVLGGVRLRYPSQFVFVYHTEGSFPTPPPSPIDEGMTERVIQGGWEETTCVDPLIVQKDCENCGCSYHAYHRESHTSTTKPNRPHRLMSNSADSIKNDRSSKSHRYRPYSGPHPTDNATPMREQPVPSSLNLSTSALNPQRRPLGPPKYATPLPSPAVTLPHSPALKPPMFPNPHFPLHVQSTPPPPPPPAVSLSSSSSAPTNTSYKEYDMSRVTNLIMATSNDKDQSSLSYNLTDTGWWQCMYLPDSLSSMQKLVSPMSPWATGFTLLPTTPHGLPSSPNVLPGDSKKGTRRVKSNQSVIDSQFPELQSPTKKKPGKQLKVPHIRSQIEVATPATLLDPRHPFQDEGSDESIDVYDSATGTTGKDPSFVIMHQQQRIDVLEADDVTLSSSNTIHKPGSGNFDLTSESAVKISGDLGELFDDSEEEDDLQKITSSGGELSHFSYPSIESNRNGKINKMNPGECHTLPDLSHIYPTPPSVESTDDKFEEGKSYLDERNEVIEANLMTKLCPFDDVIMEVIPDDFRQLNGVCNTTVTQQMKNCVYTKVLASPSLNKSQQDNSTSSLNKANSEPQKFIFPPPSSLVRNTCALSLPLSSRDQTISPFSSTPFTALPSASPSLRGGVSSRMPKRFSSVAQTPAESPFDPITPTPMSSSRLMPLLPEAHALYISLALLDSALAANVSDNVAIDFSAFQNFMLNKRNSWRTQLDSVSSSCAATSSSNSMAVGGDNDSIFNKLEDEKPLMMVGIADYPSLGFKEDIVVTTPAPSAQWNQSSSLTIGLPLLSEDEGNTTTALEFLSIIQDYCLHLCLTGKEEASQCSSIPLASTPVALHPYQQNQQDKQRSKQTCRLYHTHSVSSAIVCGKHLVNRSLSKVPSSNVGGGGVKQLPTQPSLDKEDNSAAWILDLLALPTNFVTKKLRELKTVFQNSFHHAPCIKVSTKGPLTLKDLQSLTPSQSLAGDDCLPLPMHPLVVGYDHEWMSISPLSVPTWDKLLFEPFSSPKHVMYLVVCPGGEATLDTLVNFFRNLSITFKTSRLGCHVPFDKGNWNEGIVTGVGNKGNNEEKEERLIKSEGKKEVPSSLPSSSLQKICKEVITPFLSQLPSDKEKLIDNTTHDVHLNRQLARPVPVFIVLYVVMKDSENRLLKSSGKKDGVVEVMKVMSSLLSNEQIPDSVKSRIVIQPLDESELIGHQANSTHHLRTLAFSVFSRCCPNAEISSEFHHLTGFGPISARPLAPSQVKVYYPLYILSPDPLITPLPLSSSISSSQRQQSSSILFAPDESTLFCSYCVTADKRWLIAVVCDRQAELLDTTIIGLPPNDNEGSSGSRTQALQKLWLYLISKVSVGVLTWNIVITRFGKPSSAEIKDWPRVIYNDGLMTANQLLKSECDYCGHSSCFPYIKNVIIVSIQPERNIQLFPSNDINSSVSHVLVLPPRPNSLPAMTPAEDGGMDFTCMMDDFDTSDVTLPGTLNEELFSELNEMDIDFPSTTYKEDVRAPLATGYLISTTPPGNLPSEFWGHDKPQSMCHMFKALLHSHLSVHAYPGSPPDVLCSVLLAFDALSWLSINHVTQQRNSSLPIHLFLLSKLYNFFTVISR